jgi:hypothetical protein
MKWHNANKIPTKSNMKSCLVSNQNCKTLIPERVRNKRSSPRSRKIHELIPLRLYRPRHQPSRAIRIHSIKERNIISLDCRTRWPWLLPVNYGMSEACAVPRFGVPKPYVFRYEYVLTVGLMILACVRKPRRLRVKVASPRIVVRRLNCG